MLIILVVVSLLLCLAEAKNNGAPDVPNNAIPCPYPVASDIDPCECLADPDTYQVYLICFWDFGDNATSNMAKFQGVLDHFDSFNQVYVWEMTCDQCWNFNFDGALNENTTGRFEITYFTLEHFDITNSIEQDMQFSETAFLGSKESLKYLLIDSNSYFTPSVNILAGASNMEQLRLQGIDSQSSQLPSFSSLADLRLLSLSNGNFPSLGATNFIGLDNLASLFMDSSQVSEVDSETFSNLSSLTHLSMSFNNIETIQPYTFRDLTSLAILNLGDNIIKEILDDFSGVSANTQILLQNNDIRQLNETVFRPFVEKVFNTPLSTGLIDVENNPLDCGCDVKWIVIDLEAIPVFRNARCASGINLSEVDPAGLEFFCPDL